MATTLGAYRLLELIGEGGMGEVWLAEQRQPVRRRVALKLIKAGMDTRDVIARFEAERQALALMDHPGIAKVFDAGATPQGRPYFVMEYVPGLPITAFCDKRQLSMHERLELIARVCEAVQHAHQKAIIHRDLKPSNILVSEVDGKPAPKIIDFGVAKAIAQRLTAETLFTRAGAVVGTPEYMSPEQANSGGEDVDTRTDVYSLGIVLYEVLAGALPRDYRKFAFDEILRSIREEDAPRPSTRVRTLGEESGVIAKNRRMEPRTLARQLRGDLDSITLKCIEKDRSRRYGTPAELAADIERYLRSEPVAAVPASAAYRVRKYFARHRFGTAAALVLFVLLVAFAITEAVQLRAITRERDRSDRVSQFMTEMFLVSTPNPASRGTSIPAHEILDKGLKDIDLELKNDPQLQARMLRTLGVIYDNVGFPERAESLLRRALAIQRQVLGDDDRETLRSAAALAGALANENQISAAEKVLRQTLEAQQQALHRNDPDTLASMQDLADILAREGRLMEAEKLARQALALRQQVLSPDDRQTWNSKWFLCRLLAREGKTAEAETVGQQSLDDVGRLFGRDDPQTLSCARFMAFFFLTEKKYSQAAVAARQASDIERTLPARNWSPSSGAEMLMSAFLGVRNYPEARAAGEELLSRQRRLFGEVDPKVAETLYDLACIAALAGQRDEAFSLLTQSIHQGLSRDDLALMMRDPDLQTLRGDQRFAALQAKAYSKSDRQATKKPVAAIATPADAKASPIPQ